MRPAENTIKMWTVMVFGIVIYSCLLASINGDAVANMVLYTAARSLFEDSNLCVVNTKPVSTTVGATPGDCANNCQRLRKLSLCDGFNFISNNKTCQLYQSEQLVFAPVEDCRFFKVCVIGDLININEISGNCRRLS